MTSTSSRTGAAIRDLAESRYLTIGACAVAAAVLVWGFFTTLPHVQTLGIGLVFLLVAVKGVIAVTEAKSDTKVVEKKRAVRDLVAEKELREILDQLGGEQLIIPDARCRFSTIVLSKDHGVFLIEAKPHYGRVDIVNSRILMSGKRPETDFIAQMLRDTHGLVAELQAITGVTAPVNSLFLFTNALVVTSRLIKGITVTNQKFLLTSMQRLGKPLPPEVWAAKEEIAARLGETVEG